MVPLLAAGIRSGIATDRAFSRTSTSLCEVSTLPPATAWGGGACTRLPAGARTSSGRKQPVLSGGEDGGIGGQRGLHGVGHLDLGLAGRETVQGRGEGAAGSEEFGAVTDGHPASSEAFRLGDHAAARPPLGLAGAAVVAQVFARNSDRAPVSAADLTHAGAHVIGT